MTFDELAKTKPPHILTPPRSIPFFFTLAVIADGQGQRWLRDYCLCQITDIVAARQELYP